MFQIILIIMIGIGAGTAKYFAVLKCRLSLVGRNEASLNEVAEICKQNGSPEVLVLSKDLSDAKCCQSAVQETLDYFKGNCLCFISSKITRQ